jgi:hypothetical protein
LAWEAVAWLCVAPAREILFAMMMMGRVCEVRTFSWLLWGECGGGRVMG